MEKIIEVSNLTKYYGENKAVDNISFDVYQGEILGLLGPNGSGKSTTINCLLSLLNHEGLIKIFNQEMKPNAYEIKNKIGVVFQDVAVFNELTVYENIDYFCGLYIKDKKQRKQYIQDAMELVSITKYQKYYPKELSGGLLRRLNIACGIAHKPELIFFDEPTVAVDPQSRNHILDGIKTLAKQGATIIYTTHYMEEVERLCNRIIIIDQGKIIAGGSLDELINKAKVKERIYIDINNLTDELLVMIRDRFINVEYFDNQLVLSFNSENNLNEVVLFLNEYNLKYQNMQLQRPTLNDVFLELTGKELRD